LTHKVPQAPLLVKYIIPSFDGCFVTGESALCRRLRHARRSGWVRAFTGICGVDDSEARRLATRLMALHGNDALPIAVRAANNSRQVGTPDAVRLWEEVIAAIRSILGGAG
jgi:hypothetical protein